MVELQEKNLNMIILGIRFKTLSGKIEIILPAHGTVSCKYNYGGKV